MPRKNKKKVNGFAFPVPFAGAVVAIAVLALGYVWLGCRCEAIGRDIKKLETERAALMKKHQNEELRWAQLKSPRNIERALSRHNIVMTWPRRDQVVRLYDADLDQRPSARSGGRTYARLERSAMHE